MSYSLNQFSEGLVLILSEKKNTKKQLKKEEYAFWKVSVFPSQKSERKRQRHIPWFPLITNASSVSLQLSMS